MEKKRCPQCTKILPATIEYFSQIKNTDRLRCYCKKCCAEQSKKYYDENKDKIKKQYKENCDVHKKRCKDYYENNKEKEKERHKIYRQNNVEALKRYAKKYGENNREKIKNMAAEYHKNNPEKIKEQQAKYRRNNRDAINKRKRDYHKRNSKKINQCMREYHKVNYKVARKRSIEYMNSLALFKLYTHKLTIEEDPKDDGSGYLLVKCAYCGKYFKPTNGMVRHRINSLEDKTYRIGEHRLYCSDGCKKACPIFNQHKWPKGFKPATSREVNPLIRQMCLKRDDYTCQKCGKYIDEIEIHSHHIEGATQMPMLANDVENTITLCKPCHIWVHQQPGCTYYDLRCKK